LLGLELRVGLRWLIRVLTIHDEAIDPHDCSFTGIDLASHRVSRTLNLALLVSLFDGHRSPTLLDGLDQGQGGLLDIVGQRFDGIRACKGVHRLRHVGFVRENLLGSQSQPGGLAVGSAMASS
jgi:hypothetical protein